MEIKRRRTIRVSVPSNVDEKIRSLLTNRLCFFLNDNCGADRHVTHTQPLPTRLLYPLLIRGTQ